MELKKVLYVHGYGSNENSSSGKLFQEVFGEEVKVHTVTYDPSTPVEAIAKIRKYSRENDINLMIGSSLGGFMVMNCVGSLGIVINPCVKPSVELPKIGYSGPIEDYITLENELKDAVDWEDMDSCYGCFAPEDEILGLKYKAEFKKIYNLTCEIPGGHRVTREAAEKIAHEIVPEFLKSIDAWHEGYRKLIDEGIV